MLSGIEPIIYYFITLFGLPFVVISIFLRGMLVGKMIPITVIIPAYVIVAGIDSLFGIFLLTLLTAFSKTVGQILIYRRSRRIGRSTFDFVPYMSHDTGRVERIFDGFKKYGGIAIFIGNIVLLRDLMAIPAGTEDYPAGKFIVLIYTSTLVYQFLMTVIISGGVRVFIF